MFDVFQKAFADEIRQIQFEQGFYDELEKISGFGDKMLGGMKRVGIGLAGLAANTLGSEAVDSVVAKKPKVNNVFVHPETFKQMQAAQAAGHDPKDILKAYMGTQKQAGWMGALWNGAKGLLEGGAAAAAKGVASEGAQVASKDILSNAVSSVASTAKTFATKYPKTVKALRWGAGQAAQGAGFSAAAAPFAARPQVTKVLPNPGQSNDQTSGGGY